MSRATSAFLSTENLLHNLQIIKSLAPGKKIIAMVKANAYGHGLRSTSLRLEKHVDSLGVASIDEALALRRAGVQCSVTLMEGVFEPEELITVSEQGFTAVIHESSQVEWLQHPTSSLVSPLRIWLKVNTGMGRLGFTINQAKIIYPLLSQHPAIVQPIGVMSHFACADEKAHPLNQSQQHAFANFVHDLPGPKSFCNSAAIWNFPEAQYDVVRPGLALYGASPITGKSATELHLKPVMTLTSRLIAVSHFPKGSPLGYGGRFICPENMPVGVVAIGYGDGYPRTARDGTPMLVNGNRCPIAGRVSMDMTTIDLRPCPTARVGDLVTLWGEGLPIEDVAAFTEHTAYDLFCGVQGRVKFQWSTLTQNE